MHDLDRTYMEDAEGLELGAGDEAGGYKDREASGYGDGEYASEAEVFDEGEITELAAELLGVANDQELDQFLGGFLDKAARALGSARRGQGPAARRDPEGHRQDGDSDDCQCLCAR